MTETQITASNVQRGMLATATGKQLDGLAWAFNWMKRNGGETDDEFRSRVGSELFPVYPKGDA